MCARAGGVFVSYVSYDQNIQRVCEEGRGGLGIYLERTVGAGPEGSRPFSMGSVEILV